MDFKKLFRAFAVLTAVSLVSFSFTSCGGDDDGSDGGEGGGTSTVQTPKSAMAAYNFEVSADMLEVLDITISYIDKGEIKTEKMTNVKWSYIANGLELPATFGYKIHMKVKDNANFSKASYDFITKTYSMEIAVYDQNGKKIETLGTGASSASEGGFTGITETQIRNAYADREYINSGYEVGTDGTHTKKTINWN
ncbi:MAG: hypothetical protein ACI4V5_03095 [Prevotella sp.]